MSSSAVGEVKIALKLDSSGLSGGEGSKLGSTFGNAWTVAAGNLIAAGIQKLASTVVNVGKDIITTGMNYEKAMSEVKAISGATADELDRLSQKGIQSASTSVFTTGQVAEAYKYMGMAGWDAGQMMDGLDGILALAAASNLDLGRTSDIVTDALTAFGDEAKESAHFADVLAVAATNSNTNVDMLGESFKYAGALAGTMKYSIEDVGVAMGLMANSGIKASQAGTSFRGMITRMAKPTKEVAAVMDELGISLYNTDGSARPLNDVMVNLRSSFAGLTDAEKSAAATTLAGKNALSGFLAIVNASDEDFAKMTEAMNNAEGAAQNMADTMLNNLSGAITMVQSSWDAAKTSLYTGDFDGFVTQLGQAFEGITKIVDNGAGIIAEVLPKAMTQISARIPAFASTLGTAIGKLAPALIKGLMGMLPDLIKGAMNLATSLFTELAAQLPTLIPELMQSLMDALLELTNPENLTQLIEAGLNMIMALVQGLVDAIPVLVENLPIIIQNIVTVLLDNLPMILEAGVKILLGLVQGIVNALPQLVAMVPDIIVKIVTTLVAHLPEILTTGAKILFELITGIASVWGDLQEKAKEIPAAVVQKVKDALPELLAKGSEMLNKLVEGIKAVWTSITGAAQDIFNTVVNKVAEMPGNLYNKGVDLLTKLVNGVKSVWNKITKAATDIFNAVVDTVKKIPEEMLNIGKNIVEGLWNGINGAVGWLKDKVTGFASSVLDSIKSAFGIGSPSKLFRDQVGVFLAQGVGVGFTKEVESVATDMEQALADNFGVALGLGMPSLDIPEPDFRTTVTSLAEFAMMAGEEDEEMETAPQPLFVTLEMDGQQIQQVILQDIRRSA